VAPILPGLSDRPDLLADVVRAARAAGATGVWANLLYLKPGTKEHFLGALARDWPDLLPEYEKLYARRAYLPAEETKPLRRSVSALVREFDIADRRVQPAKPEREPEQLTLAV
jgi:DNA repair photolyase